MLFNPLPMKLLLIDTSTDNCSVSISASAQPLCTVEQAGKRLHSEVLNAFIQQALQKAGTDLSELAGVAVGKGPGSYTGLRIGVSTAKALCYALSVPLVGINSLTTLAWQARASVGDHNAAYCPMLDARRMEVYTALYDGALNPVQPTSALVVDETKAEELLEGQVMTYLVGEGATKAAPYFKEHDAELVSTINYPSAAGMAELAGTAIATGQTEDVATFEPFYLKGVAAGKNEKLTRFLNT